MLWREFSKCRASQLSLRLSQPPSCLAQSPQVPRTAVLIRCICDPQHRFIIAVAMRSFCGETFQTHRKATKQNYKSCLEMQQPYDILNFRRLQQPPPPRLEFQPWKAAGHEGIWFFQSSRVSTLKFGERRTPQLGPTRSEVKYVVGLSKATR
jgi:hypothetical protein